LHAPELEFQIGERERLFIRWNKVTNNHTLVYFIKKICDCWQPRIDVTNNFGLYLFILLTSFLTLNWCFIAWAWYHCFLFNQNKLVYLGNTGEKHNTRDKKYILTGLCLSKLKFIQTTMKPNYFRASSRHGITLRFNIEFKVFCLLLTFSWELRRTEKHAPIGDIFQSKLYEKM